MPADVGSLLRIEVPLIVRIGERAMPMEEVLTLGPGSIIELTKQADDELQILVNNKPVGLGRAVKVGENFGVRVTYVGDVRQRLDALGNATREERIDHRGTEGTEEHRGA
jgi:flagellar motor switch protein FliN/FliY